ncbi:263_t:CDS:2 [Funneliformis geosporum]|uniref:6097_t:CDS:1 n=1 Tax=Funneliformis geosporum TaxID=1117311 RepID=A0A9W4WM94_9GLOM|nr:6097_t:CDS:2 [Funneliformis geosporum]CAI2197674.1 263_t:CDS:2 [Funneliformis geosporum]
MAITTLALIEELTVQKPVSVTTSTTSTTLTTSTSSITSNKSTSAVLKPIEDEKLRKLR